MRRLTFIIISAVMLCLMFGCSEDGNGDNAVSSDLQSQTAASGQISSPPADLDWWDSEECFAAFVKYDGHGTEKQEQPESVRDINAKIYVLYDVPKEDYIAYWHKLEESGLELYDYNFGLFSSEEIVKSAESGYAVFVKDEYMLELNYSDYSHELIFEVYISNDRGE